MSVAYQKAQKQRYRVTLEFEVFDDFDPHQLDWEKVFKLEPAERVEAYVEDHGIEDTIKSYQSERQKYYESLSTFDTFGKGWTRRVTETTELAVSMI